MTENKKTLLFSILGVILLLVVVIGVSYAMYTFSAQGSKVNQITTGTISLSYQETSQVTLTNAYPSTDATGSAVTGHDLVFTVTGSITGSTSVKYDLALANVTPGATLTAEHIKFNLNTTKIIQLKKIYKANHLLLLLIFFICHFYVFSQPFAQLFRR